MESLGRDLRLALRTLVRAPAFTLVAVGTLAIGIGANTAIFSVIDGVLLRDLPYRDPASLVTVRLDAEARGGPARAWLSPPDLEAYRAEPGLFEAIGSWEAWRPTLSELGDPEVLTAPRVTAGMLEDVLGVQPMLGRGFLPEEDRGGAAGTVILGHAFWQERFGGDPGALTRSIVLDGEPHMIVGVMPERFEAPFVPGADVWVAARLDPALCGLDCYRLRAIARLAEGVPLEVGRLRAAVVAARLEEAHPEARADVGVGLSELQAELVRPAQRALWVLLGAVGFVLLIACTNVANLLLVRGAAREREMHVRVAVGAGRGPILRQLLAESLVLASLSGLLGLGIAAWGTDTLLAMVPIELPGASAVAVDGRILAFAATLTLGTVVLFGFFPALRISASATYARVQAAGGRSGFAERLRSGLVVTQVALAVVLLVGAGLLIRSVHRLGGADLGFQPDDVLAVSLALPASRYGQDVERIAFHDALMERLRGLPGVLAAGATGALPLAGDDRDADFLIQGEPPPGPAAPNATWVRPVTGGYFYAMGIDLLAGRDFAASDDLEAEPVVIVNEALARRYLDYPRRSPLGLRMRLGGGSAPVWRTVVGVVEDTRHFSLRDGARPATYVPFAQLPSGPMSVVLRTAGEPLDLAEDVRGALASVDPALAAARVEGLRDAVEETFAPELFVTRLLGLFALIALVLAAVGLYGVVSYGVTRRLREMGIRVALGAPGAEVRRLVVRGGLGLALLGIAAGVAGALAVAGVLEALLYEISVTDPLTFLATVVALATVALLASWFPAVRASRTDPVQVMRTE